MNKFHDKEYYNLITNVLQRGVAKGDRTGTGTLSLPFQQMRFDLTDYSIPLLTSKQMHLKSIIHEILWYLNGSGSGRYLRDNNIRIWNEWMTDDGHLDYVYGYQWRQWATGERQTPTLIKLKPKCGNDNPYTIVPNEKLSQEYSGTKSDDIIGMFVINKEGDEFKVIKKIEGGKNSRYLIQFNDEFNTIHTALRPAIQTGTPRNPNKKNICNNEGCMGTIYERPSYYTKAYNMWYNMMRRCHDDTLLPEYLLYGGDGVFVDSEWRCFSNFLHDIKYLPGFKEWRDAPHRYCLDKDYYGSNCYSKHTCVFISSLYNKQLTNLDGCKYIATNEETGEQEEFTVMRDFAKKIGIHGQSISYAVNESPNNYTHEWNIQQHKPPAGYAWRKQLFIDQIQDIIDRIKNNPNDRRIILNAWNVSDLNEMALPPCHAMFQFWCDPVKKELKCHLYQRSADSFLGVPFNIVQYSILTHMIAHVTGYKATEFVWTGGDVHLYNNHIDKAKTQLTREPYASPTILLNPSINNIDDFKFDDIEIHDYKYHPSISAKVSI